MTAGPTREHIDPVRFISNYSTGIFGYAIAKEAVRRGCRVVLVSGPTGLQIPRGVKFVRVETAEEMREAVKKEYRTSDCVIMAAAVSDWRPRHPSKRKIKRSGGKVALELEENPDILRELGRRKKAILAGFCLETENLEKNALKKIKDKNLDLIIANPLKKGLRVFGDKLVDVMIIDKFGNKEDFRRKGKGELAKIILDRVLALKFSANRKRH